MPGSTECPPGFKMLRVKHDPSCKHSREILFKPNETKREDEEKPRGRTLLVVNIPPYCTQSVLRKIFVKFGSITAIHSCHKLSAGAFGDAGRSLIRDHSDDDLKYFPKKHEDGFYYAFIVYDDFDAVALAMKEAKETPVLLSGEGHCQNTGMRKWLDMYSQQYPDKLKLQENVDAFMAKYDVAVENAEKEEEDAAAEDEDGWVKVTRKGKNPVIPRTEANQIRARAKEKMRRKRKELLHAYSYQIRESKRQKIAELRRKFEEDKKQIGEMKNARKFRPF